MVYYDMPNLIGVIFFFPVKHDDDSFLFVICDSQFLVHDFYIV